MHSYSIAIIIIIQLQNAPNCQIQILYPFSNSQTKPSLIPQPLPLSILLSVFVNLAALCTLYEWNHAVFVSWELIPMHSLLLCCCDQVSNINNLMEVEYISAHGFRVPIPWRVNLYIWANSRGRENKWQRKYLPYGRQGVGKETERCLGLKYPQEPASPNDLLPPDGPYLFKCP